MIRKILVFVLSGFEILDSLILSQYILTTLTVVIDLFLQRLISITCTRKKMKSMLDIIRIEIESMLIQITSKSD